MLTYTTSELFVRWAQPLLPPEAAQKLKQGPAVARRPPRGFAAQVHQLALIWRPGKGTEDAHFLGRNPGAICGHRDQELFPQTAHRGRLASSDLLSQLDIGPSYEPFHGSPPIFAISVTIDLKRPQISSFREQNSVPPETRIPEFHARAHMVCPSSCLGSLGQIELSGGNLT